MTHHPMHIILDGSDNLGKTTTLNMLSEKLQLPVIKMPNMKEYIERDMTEQMSQLFSETIVQFKDYPFLMDRGYCSSIVYSKVFNRTFDLSYIDKINEELRPKIIIFTGRDKHGQIYKYKSFCNDPIYHTGQKMEIDAAFCKYAETNGYPLIEVWGKTTKQILQEVLLKIYE